tara:strand:- start:3968 stop:4360 length:393 start_codon:yes stop_codon:yes gene_type:complete
MGHPIHKHMHTHITKSNVHAAIRDDKAHMDYLKRDIKDDARGKGDGNKEWETADEKHITHLAEDVRYDEKKEHVSRISSSPVNNLKGKDGELVPSTEGVYRKSSSPAKMDEIMWEGEGHNLTDIDIKENK